MAIITISRGTMSGGDALAECLAAHLGYPKLAREVLVQAAEKLGVPEETLRWKILKRARFWERWTGDRRLYLIALQAALAEHCLSGNLVYHGNAGHLLLKGLPAVLRVRLIAPKAARIRTLMDREGLSYKSALDYINCADRDRIEWTKFVYRVNWRDPKLYDMVLNLDQITMDAACSVISSTVTLPDYEVTDGVRKALVDFALACRVKLALAMNVRTRNIDFEVRADDGKVEVFGELAGAGVLVKQAGPSGEDILLMVKTVDGVKDASLSLRRFPDYPET